MHVTSLLPPRSLRNPPQLAPQPLLVLLDPLALHSFHQNHPLFDLLHLLPLRNSSERRKQPRNLSWASLTSTETSSSGD